MKPIAISKPTIGKNEIKKVISVLRSGMLSQGKYVKQFEYNFAKYIGVKYAVAVSNGTIALYLALKSLDISQNDEVITTPFTFAATIEAIIWLGAIPVFVDIEKHSYNIDPKKIEKVISKKTKAILPVHLYGYPADMNAILPIAQKYHLSIIEDCAQAHGAGIRCQGSGVRDQERSGGKKNNITYTETYNLEPKTFIWKKVGSIGNVGCFSFYATKNMTCGEGGMITTNSQEIYEKCLLWRNHGSKTKYFHDVWGANFRLTDIQAAIALEQLKKLESNNIKRRKNAEFFNIELENLQGLQLPVEKEGYYHVYHQYTIKTDKDFPLTRDHLADFLKKKGIDVHIYYPVPLHKQPVYIENHLDKKKIHLPKTDESASGVLSLPVHPLLKRSELEYIVKVISEIYTKQT